MNPLWDFLRQAGPGALVTLAIGMVLTGLLVPRSTLRDVQKERDAWKEVALASYKQNTDLLVSARVTDKVMSALPTANTTQTSEAKT